MATYSEYIINKSLRQLHLIKYAPFDLKSPLLHSVNVAIFLIFKYNFF